MNRKDFKNVCMVAGGTAIAAVGGAAMYAGSAVSASPTAGELLIDLAQIATIVAPLAGIGGLTLAAIGLIPLAIKYGKKLYDIIRGKSIEYSQAKTTQKNNVRGHLKADLAKGFNRGADINLTRQSKPMQKNVSKAKIVRQQSQR